MGYVAQKEPGQRQNILGIQQLLFAQPHVAFVVGLGGHDAAVIFEVQLVAYSIQGERAFLGSVGQMVRAGCHRFVIPRRSILGIEFGFDVGEETLSGAEIHRRRDSVWTDPVQAAVEHGARRAATVITDSVQVHHQWSVRK